MLIYNYSPKTGEYTNANYACLDPEETATQGHEIYLIPAYATTLTPLEVQDNQVNVFENNNWVVKSDFRNLYIVNEDMEPKKVEEIGDLPSGYVLITSEQIHDIELKGKNYYIIKEGCLVLNPNYDQEQEAEEEARIKALYMTRSDFFDGTIKAFGADSDDLLIAIEAVLNTVQIPEIEKKVAINNYRNALNFYRKHPLFTMLADVPIPIGQNVTIQITSKQWDKFFDETNKKNPNAYKELLPTVSVVAESEVEEENTETEVEEEQPEEGT